MVLISPDFQNNEVIPEHFTCKGGDLCPALEIRDVPKTAKSLALVMSDPDAPAGTFFHWVVWNLPVNTRKISNAFLPAESITGVNSAGKKGYTSPCPPSGTHHYEFVLYALDASLQLTSESRADMLLQALQGHILEQVTLTGLVSH